MTAPAYVKHAAVRADARRFLEQPDTPSAFGSLGSAIYEARSHLARADELLAHGYDWAAQQEVESAAFELQWELKRRDAE